MIAPLEHRRRTEPSGLQREHMLAIEEEENRIPRRLQNAIEAQPAIAVATAMAVGVVIGWLVKRKNW
ncbi:hypothetical protein [Novipirellula rosea]|uniref:DUF883 domain-containing protein n=1 Tax=Novipirellula rosea TaxID=1031540 RepID=A0ABP8MSK7_9BACT|tara:strand:+ start:6237 stop:6437 length:201 start_codon:yes stop_codon:yes gene_type:complete